MSIDLCAKAASSYYVLPDVQINRLKGSLIYNFKLILKLWLHIQFSKCSPEGTHWTKGSRHTIYIQFDMFLIFHPKIILIPFQVQSLAQGSGRYRKWSYRLWSGTYIIHFIGSRLQNWCQFIIVLNLPCGISAMLSIVLQVLLYRLMRKAFNLGLLINNAKRHHHKSYALHRW